MKVKKQPIAIVGIGCRLPGDASSPEKFWDLLVSKKDAIVDVPADRWDSRRFFDQTDGKPAKIRTNQGGFLKNNLKEFDPLFFGISPVEAETLDPQSRILLEVAYEALEDTGMTLENIKGTKTGVFVGGFTIDNYLNWGCKENVHLVNSHTSLGITLTMLANRLSYFFDLKGPSLTIDTACSSSLVATHYACQSIWNGESEMALVGGVNAMTTPLTFISMSKGQFLSKHGRCKTFDSDAGGYVRAEGGGIVVLKSYEKALADGDRIYALIEGTGSNQDGQTNGITVPNQESQKALIRRIYAENGVSGKDIDYIEAHGTGTPVGDPIEFGALNAVMSETRTKDDKLFVGSVKSNIGHLEAGAGVAGLIKTALCLHHNKVPANLHFNNPNPKLNYEESVLKVATDLEDLPDRTSYASVNSFGYGGTNAHVLLKQVTQEQENVRVTPNKENNIVFPITAKSKNALKKRVGDYRKYIQENEGDFNEMWSNIAHRRSFHSDRLAVFANSKEDLVEKLEAFEEDMLVKGVAYGVAPTKKPKIAYVYTGMGPQWWKMGRELMETEPVFLKAVEECDEVFKTISGWSIIEELGKPEEVSRVKETNIAQTANFVVQVGLTKLMEHYGITPDAVVGHSVGEVTSLYISGALTLEDALTVSYHRSRLQHTTEGKGSMLAVGLSEADVMEHLNGYDDVSIAAINSNKAVTLAGEDASLQELLAKFEGMNVFARMLKVAVPYHSPVMNLIKDELLESLDTLQGNKTTTDLYSTVTATKITGTEIDNHYWWRNVREPVRFAKTFDKLVEDGYTLFIEVGPHPVLKNSMMECANYSKEFHFLQTLNRKEPEQLNFYENLSALFTCGYDLKWNRWIDKVQQLTLPRYPWQKKHYWLESKKSIENKIGREGNVFMNYKLDAPVTTYQVELNDHFFPFLKDHHVQERVVFPGAGYVAAAIALHQSEFGEKGSFGIEDIKFHQMLTVEDTDLQSLFITLKPKSNHFDIQSKIEEDDSPWIQRATGKCIAGSYAAEAEVIDVNAIADTLENTMTKEAIYEKLSNAELEYGPTFRGIDAIRYNKKELVATIKACDSIRENKEEHFIHPGLLDSCFQTLVAFEGKDNVPVVPVSIGKIQCYSSPGTDFVCYTRLRAITFNAIIADITICDADGKVAMTIEGIKCQEITSSSTISDEFPENCLYQPNWAEESVDANVALTKMQDSTFLVVTDDYASSIPLTEQLPGEVMILQPGTDLRELGDNHYEVNLSDASTIAKVLEGKNPSKVEVIYLTSATNTVQETIDTEACLEIINPIYNLIKYCSDAFPRNLNLNLITQNGHVVTEDDRMTNLGTSIFIGLGRLMSNEFPGWNVRLIDFEANKEATISKETWKLALAKMNASKRSFEELAIRDGSVYKKVMRKADKPQEEKTIKTVAFSDCALTMTAPEYGDVNTINFKETERTAPEANEIEISIQNATIGSRDYLKATSKISSDAFEGTYSEDSIGTDCAGVVTKVGANVAKFKVGDNVMALSKGAFKSFTTVNENLATRVPEGFNANASQVLMPYLTAIYALEKRANLGKGDKLVVHNATDNVGLAAINYAKSVGAEIFATVQGTAQREYLNSLGITHVFEVNDLDFSNKIMEITQGKGVDVILGSVAGETLHQSLAILASYGVYLEIGKTNAIKDELMSMKVFSKNLSFISVDIDQLCKERPEKVAELLETIQTYIASGQLEALPEKVFAANNISQAFAAFEDADHVGSIVVNFKDVTIEIEEAEAQLFKSDRSYLITGGTRGLGLEIGNWMLNQGAKNLVLMSRSGDKNPQVKARIDALRDKGANILVFGVDVADPTGMREVFNQIEAELPPLAGIFHCAMVLDDGFLLDMTDERFKKVLKPKADGAMLLHELSKDHNLDTFVMFSSLSSLIGHLGQANYVVANTILDSFAYVRQSQGLPATTINLGVLGQSGVIARDENLKKMVLESGIRSFTNEEVLIALGEIVKRKSTQIGFFDIDWEVMEKSFKSSKTSLFEELIKENVGLGSKLNEEQSKYWNQITTKSVAERQELVEELIKEELSQILKMPKDRIPADKGVNFLGVDSILSVQLIRAINSKLAVELSPMEFTSGPNLRQLSKIVIEKIVNTSTEENILENAIQIK